MATPDIRLGVEARDKITGFSGIIIAHVRYLTGCDQYGLTPKSKDGEVKDTQYFDDGRIEVTGAGITEQSVASEKKGGPNRDAPSR